MGRPNRGSGSAGPKNPGGLEAGGGREQYSINPPEEPKDDNKDKDKDESSDSDKE
jgi:hypothetical protein